MCKCGRIFYFFSSSFRYCFLLHTHTHTRLVNMMYSLEQLAPQHRIMVVFFSFLICCSFASFPPSVRPCGGVPVGSSNAHR